MPGDFPPFEMIDGDPRSNLVLLCDHASNALPDEYGSLGLPEAELERHIGYDIGAASLTRCMAAMLEAPALLTRFSRLLIDPNRGLDDPTLVMRLSDGALIPGNARIDRDEIDLRVRRFYRPYDEAIHAIVTEKLERGIIPVLVSIHSFTPVWRSRQRPWQVAVLWDRDPRLALPLIKALRQNPSLVVGDNEPYDGALEGDTLYRHATLRGIAHALIEIRQDLVTSPQGVSDWAGRMAEILKPLLVKPDIATIKYFGSRTGVSA